MDDDRSGGETLFRISVEEKKNSKRVEYNNNYKIIVTNDCNESECFEFRGKGYE